MSYELFRSSFAASISGRLAPELTRDVLQALDYVASQYDIHKACTDLIIPGQLPDVAKMYLAALAVENKAAGTIQDYHRHLTRFFENIPKPYNLVTTNDIRIYLFNYQKASNLKKSSLEHVRVVINAFFSWLVDEELMERNPARRIEPIRASKEGRKAIPAVELERIRMACETPREKALIDFLFSSGCRISECTALTLDDINWADRSVRIRHGKGDKARTTYFNAEAEVSLKHYLSSREGESNVLFCRSRAPYGHITKEALEAEVRRIRARVPGLTVQVVPHALRTTFATTLASSGTPVQHVQQLLGHASLDTTMRYVHNADDDVKTSHRKYMP